MGDSLEAKDLPPPRISQEKINRLLRALTTDSLAAADSSSSTQPPPQQQLKGRDVLIPTFGGVAFYEGELCPETRSKPGSKGQEEEEVVYVSTDETKTTKRSPGKKQQQTQNQPDEKDIAVVSISEAIEWLRKYSSGSQNSSTKAPAKATITPSGKTGPSKAPSSTKNSTGTAPKQLPKSRSRKSDQAPAGPMFNINEEYSADGARIVGEAVNLSTRLKAVYGDDNPENFDQHRGTDSAMESEDEEEDEEKTATAGTKHVSDEEYDRISNRLEELALMEEEEAKRNKEGRSKPVKPLGGGTGASSQARKTKAKSSSSFGFQKGFLNKKKSSRTKADKCCDKGNPFKATNKRCGPQCSSKKNQESPDSKPISNSGVTIDVSQNKVHEIPREGRQQPVPPRKPQDQALAAQHTNGNRLLHNSVFSGQISERTSGVISKDVAARVAANEQTQNLQHELEQQQQRQARPKRVSRFRQQRLQEQQQQR